MCGIAGLYDRDGERSFTGPLLSDMVSRLEHRGPDGQGFHYGRGIALGHARLAIIDLETGDQPIHNEDRTIWVVFNGEIFNHVELRQDLVHRGHQFYTTSDTEVIVHLYEEHGTRFVDHLNGQFAIALWDEGERRLILARDRVGIIPLFYSKAGSCVAFGSEVKALLPALGTTRLNPTALDQIMTFWAPVSPETIFDGISEVPPGSMIIAQNGELDEHRYWDWLYPTATRTPESDIDPWAPSGAVEELRHLLKDAIRIRLRSDVPVGAYLSGGVDSSALAALVSRECGDQLRTFSVGFAEPTLDETVFQGIMVDHLGTHHSHVTSRGDDVVQDFLTVIRHTETPILRTAPVPMYRLSALVRESGYKVVLTGEGADEVFGGYDLFKEGKIRHWWARHPESEIRPTLLKRLYPYLDLQQKQTLPYLRSFFGVGLEAPDSPFFSHLPRWITTSRTKSFFSDDLKAHLRDRAQGTLAKTLPPMEGWDFLQKAQYVEAKTLMGGYLLSSQGDRMLMANSVEGRFPYLDHRVIDLANSLPSRLKMHVLREKHVLKQAVARYLPHTIVERHKQPYRAPDIPAFFSGKIPDFVESLMSESSVRRSGYFDPKRVARLMKKAKQGRAIGAADNMAFVGVLSTQAWHQEFVGPI